MQSAVHQKGFTVIELMVVLATLGVLAAMLVPALAQTRQNSQVVQCLANQRQLAVAWIMFARDNNDRLVQNRGLDNAPNTYLGNPLLMADLKPGAIHQDWCPGNMRVQAVANSQDLWIEAGLLYPYLKSLQVYHCPADKTLVPHGVAPPIQKPAVRTYSMNNWVGSVTSTGAAVPWAGGGWYVYTKLSDMVKPGPSKTWVFIEESPYSLDDGYFIVDPNEITMWNGLPAVLHGNASVLAYADGHSDTHRWTDQNMITAPATPPSPGNVMGIPADPNSGDLPWLNSISTAPR